ncbi:MAG: redox-regulated ATPase YchF [Candidatus Wildermuthbacteria bacterium GWA2_46_15]|uniref:Ribosome-binding ATPase YchF n=1 Tax=Candidatus Wildermuthbacteria bacterium GWA2_46_15 TaxID=1802443 RepID=A0A1G2QPL0_9BACT|nr:MAG: redox-regulated ATPase YchF [Candidatus Wildermuthbacteria bacterium GWA2_46_15]
MSLSIGIVGLPNVGKSTLFQTLTKKQVDRSNYPFATIDPNVGVVGVPDERVEKLAEREKSVKKIYATVEFVDIAGLVKGAATGEGLGNKFLSHIREVDAIIYLLRAFQKADVINTQTGVDPLREKEILETELILKDLETVQKSLDHLEGEVRAGKREAAKETGVLNKIKGFLDQGRLLNEADFSKEERELMKNSQLLSAKPRLYLLNGQDEEVPAEIIESFKKNQWPFLIVDVLTEFEAAESGFNQEERISLGLVKESELDVLIKKSYGLLDLLTFFTTGLDETRAWTVKKGSLAPQAAGVIHSDFESHFIKAEVIAYTNLIAADGFSQAREKGLIRTEGKEYVVQDGDVIEIKHNA